MQRLLFYSFLFIISVSSLTHVSRVFALDPLPGLLSAGGQCEEWTEFCTTCHYDCGDGSPCQVCTGKDSESPFGKCNVIRACPNGSNTYQTCSPLKSIGSGGDTCGDYFEGVNCTGGSTCGGFGGFDCKYCISYAPNTPTNVIDDPEGSCGSTLGITVKWDYDSRGGHPAKFFVYRGTSSGFTPNGGNWIKADIPAVNDSSQQYTFIDNRSGGQATGTNPQNDTPLVDGTTYYYKIIAYNIAGSKTSLVSNGALPPPSICPPNAPTNPSATTDTNCGGSVRVTWGAPSGGGTPSGYNVYRGTSSIFTANSSSKLNSSLTTSPYYDFNAQPGRMYYYKIGAVNSGGETISPTVVGARGSPICSPSVSASPGACGGRVNVSWTDVDEETGYDLHRGTSSTFIVSGSNRIGTGGTTFHSYNDTTPLTDTNYYYKVVATNGITDGNSATSSTQGIANTDSSLVCNTTVTVNTGGTCGGEMDIYWTAAVGAQDYTLHRGATSGFSPTSLNDVVTRTTPPTSLSPYRDTGLTPALTYYYKVVTSGTGGDTVTSPADFDQASNICAATTPTGLTATTGTCGNNKVILTWNAVAGATSYDLRRGTTVIYTGSTTTFTDNAPAPDTGYSYSVRANNAGGSSSYSTAVTGTSSDACAPAVPTGLSATTGTCGNNKVVLDWNPSTGATDYQLRRGITIIYDGALTTFTDNAPSPGTSYSYSVRASNSNGSSAYSASDTAISSDLCPPSVPTGLTATTGTCDDNKVVLDWNASTGSGPITYDVRRGVTIVSPGPGTATAYTDNAPSPNVTYTYSVRATNAGGSSLYSTSDSASSSDQCTYTISGNVFVDIDGDGRKDAGEQNYTGSSISLSGREPGGSLIGTDTTNTGGFTILGSGFVQGTDYSVSLNQTPLGFYVVNPRGSIPPAFSGMQVGSTCAANLPANAYEAACSAGNITGLNFAISNQLPWIRTYGLDTRFDSGFDNRIPAGPSCGGAYLSLPGTTSTPPPGSAQNRAGITFIGGSSESGSFGSGQASPNPFNWVIGSSAPEAFSPIAPAIIHTSHRYVQDIVSRSGITPRQLNTLSGCASPNIACNLTALQSGVYSWNGPVQITMGAADLIPANVNAVILVNGILTINSNILFNSNTLATFIASDDIRVTSNVGQATASCPPTTNLDGFYSTDENLVIEGINDCSVGVDRMLNVSGSVVINADLSDNNTGTIQVQRNLCDDNLNFPTFTVSAQPQFILKTPAFLRQRSNLFQEVAP